MAGIKTGRVTDEISSMTRNAKAKAVADSGSDSEKDAMVGSLRKARVNVYGSASEKNAPNVTPQNAEPTKARKINDRILYKPLGTEGEGE
jgi:hypothetical protein